MSHDTDWERSPEADSMRYDEWRESKEPSDLRSAYGMTPEQLHAGIDRLWKALRITSVQDKDVFTLAAERLVALETELAESEAECEERVGRVEFEAKQAGFAAGQRGGWF